MGKIKIETSYIKRTGRRSRLCADVQWNNRCRTLWFEVESEFEEYLCYERADGFLIALLPFAMINNLDIEVNGCVSEKLLYQLKSLLLPTLASNIPKFHLINIYSKTDNTVLKSQNSVGTGLTGGIDAFYTVLNHMTSPYNGYNLTHITFFNIMNSPMWKSYGEDSSRDFFNARVEYIRPVVGTLGLKFVPVDTNFDLMYRDLSLMETCTFRFFGMVLAIQKLFKNYYWSSSYTVSQFKVTISDIEYFDLLSLHCVSNENMVFYSTGSEVSRLEKTKFISDFEITYNYLNVCWLEIHNCTRCDKCMRTMMSLYSIGKLNHYSKVFDLEYFLQNKDKYIGYMLFGSTHPEMKKWYTEILKCYLDNNLKITCGARIYAKKLQLSELKQQIISMISK